MRKEQIKAKKERTLLAKVTHFPLVVLVTLLGLSLIVFWIFVPLTYEFTDPVSRNRGQLLFFTICGGAYILFVLLMRLAMDRESEGAFWAQHVHKQIRRIDRKLKRAKRKKGEEKPTKFSDELLRGIKPLNRKRRTLVERVFELTFGTLIIFLPLALVFFSFFVGLMHSLIEFGFAEYDGSVLMFVLDAMAKGLAFDFFESYELDLYPVNATTLSVQSVEFAIRTLTSFALIGVIFSFWSRFSAEKTSRKYQGKPKELFAILEREYLHAASSPFLRLSNETLQVINETIIPYYRHLYVLQTVKIPKNALSDMSQTNVGIPEKVISSILDKPKKNP